jgi:AcrR family transcriptional regulator
VSKSEGPPPATTPPALPKAARQRDPRSLRSQESMRNALLRLIEGRQLEKITLREITSEAGVSYPTFFNHYDSKEELFQDIARNEIIDLLAIFRKGRNSPGWRPGENMCVYVMERRSLWRTLLTAGATDAMRSEFIRRGRDLASDRPNLGHGFPFELLSGIIASGTFEIISWWLSQEAEYSVETVSNMLETLVIEPALNLPSGYFTSRKGLAKE